MMRRPKAVTQTMDDNTFASNPGLIAPAWEKIRVLQPELFPSVLWKATNKAKWQRYEVFLTHIEEHLSNGDSRAAVVLEVQPLIVAAYTDELDCVVLLRFADEIWRGMDLNVGSRLLSINTYSARSEGIARDLVLGEKELGRWGNFMPFIAEFYSDDLERINARKATIAESEWQRTERLGREALRRRVVPRSGRPTKCFASTV